MELRSTEASPSIRVSSERLRALDTNQRGALYVGLTESLRVPFATANQQSRTVVCPSGVRATLERGTGGSFYEVTKVIVR